MLPVMVRKFLALDNIDVVWEKSPIVCVSCLSQLDVLRELNRVSASVACCFPMIQ